MKIDKLIKKLMEVQKTHPGLNVSLLDCRKNLGTAGGDNNSEGVYDFDVEILEITNKAEKKYFKDQNGYAFKPWIALSFENDDYNDDGILIAEK